MRVLDNDYGKKIRKGYLKRYKGKIMKKKLCLLVVVLMLCACHKSNQEPQQKEVIQKEDFQFQTVQTPYIYVRSPVVFEDTVYMAIADDKDEELGLNHLVELNLKTNETINLFDTEHEYGNIQGLAVNKDWLLFHDMDLWGVKDNIWFMNRKTKEMKKINQIATEAPSFTVPILIDDYIIWNEEEKFVDGKIKGSIYVYNCHTNEKKRIAEMEEMGVHNYLIRHNGYKLLWSDTKDNQSYYHIYDMETESLKLIPTTRQYAMHPILLDNYIVSDEFDKEKLPRLMVYNIHTGQHKAYSGVMNGYYPYHNLVIGSNGEEANAYSVREDLTLKEEHAFKLYESSSLTDDYCIVDESVIFIKKNNQGTMLYILINDNVDF